MHQISVNYTIKISNFQNKKYEPHLINILTKKYILKSLKYLRVILTIFSYRICIRYKQD